MDIVQPFLEHVKGNTWCIVTKRSRIPLFKLKGGRVVLIDSGISTTDRVGILSLLAQNALTVAAILTSHAHVDHIGNHKTLQKEQGSKLYMTPFDAAISENPLYAQAYFYGINYQKVIKYTATYRCHADYLIRPEDEFIDVEGARFKILRLSGHTVEHLGFVTPDSVAYLADALLSDHVLESVRIPYCINCALDLDTKERIGEMNYDSYIVAHNGVYENIGALVKRNIDNILSKVDIIYKIADHYMSMEQILAKTCAALGIRMDSIYKIRSSEQSVRVYMEYLIEEGRLVQRANNGIIEYIRTDCT